MDTEQKLNILAKSSRFDLSCACKYQDEPGRERGPEGHWIYPAVLPSGRKVFLLKTLQSNACVNDCSYCPFNARWDVERCTLGPDQMARIFMELLQAGRVEGLFLSSGVCGKADQAMARMLATVELLRRRYQFRGYIHLKIIPGACRAAIEQAIRMASRVSVNIESPNADRLGRLTQRKDFYQDIIAIMRQIREGYQEIGRSCTQTTQFVVGAAGESDREIVRSTARLYERFAMNRVYFSAFQDPEVISPRENVLFSDMPTKRHTTDSNSFIREHRLYQVDFLLRKYRFGMDDIYFDEGDRLSLRQDPKRVWAERHPEFFPVDINRVEYDRLLRVPGIGPVGASRILNTRRRSRIRTLSELSKLGVRSRICGPFIRLAGRSADRMLPFHR